MTEKKPSFHILLLCYFSYLVLIFFGYLRDFLRNIGIEKNNRAIEVNRKDHVALYKSFESFFTRNLYRRVCDVWNVPITGVPGTLTTLIDRTSNDYNWNFRYPGTTTEIINMGSYNYLGFAENIGPNIDSVEDSIKHYGVGLSTPTHEFGTTDSVIKLEKQMARYLGVESSIVFGMGFATNSTNIQTLVTKGCLVLSDEFNHSSLVLGCRLSGATIRVFHHNDMIHLEEKIRESIIEGQPQSHRSWRKILIIVEGIYSMEGAIVNLPQLIKIKKKYKSYIFLDEAHSVGALGPKGRGVCDYYGCDPNDIDVLMGTFSKSFGAAGGYIAGKKNVIDYIRKQSCGAIYANPMSPPIAQQILGVIRILMGEDGTNQGKIRIRQLARNTKYFRKRLIQMGFIIYGSDDSPVVPLLICFGSKIPAIIRLAFEKFIGLIGVGFPATSLTSSRVRFCISASHTKQLLDKCLEVMDDIGDKLAIKYSKGPKNIEEIIY